LYTGKTNWLVNEGLSRVPDFFIYNAYRKYNIQHVYYPIIVAASLEIDFVAITTRAWSA
jgi:hypothetical protein